MYTILSTGVVSGTVAGVSTGEISELVGSFFIGKTERRGETLTMLSKAGAFPRNTWRICHNETTSNPLRGQALIFEDFIFLD